MKLYSLAAPLALSLAVALLGQSPVSGTTDAPADQEAILERIRIWGSSYVDSLPDFLCAQTTEQYRGNRNGTRWKQGDTYVSKLVFTEGREKRTLEAVNGKALTPTSRGFARRPLTTEGEFGILLSNIVGDASAASFTWSRWEDSPVGKLAVFTYVIDIDHSTIRLTDGPYQAKVPYNGEIVAEPATGRVWRVVSHSDTPSTWEMHSLTTTIRYAPVAIGGKQYVMPQEATVEAELRDGRLRNRLLFSQYQKFETGSTITFGPAQ